MPSLTVLPSTASHVGSPLAGLLSESAGSYLRSRETRVWAELITRAVTERMCPHFGRSTSDLELPLARPVTPITGRP